MVLAGLLMQGRAVPATPAQAELSTLGRAVPHTTGRAVQDTLGRADRPTMVQVARHTLGPEVHVTQDREELVIQAQVVPERTVRASAVRRFQIASFASLAQLNTARKAFA